MQNMGEVYDDGFHTMRAVVETSVLLIRRAVSDVEIVI